MPRDVQMRRLNERLHFVEVLPLDEVLDIGPFEDGLDDRYIAGIVGGQDMDDPFTGMIGFGRKSGYERDTASRAGGNAINVLGFALGTEHDDLPHCGC